MERILTVDALHNTTDVLWRHQLMMHVEAPNHQHAIFGFHLTTHITAE